MQLEQDTPGGNSPGGTVPGVSDKSSQGRASGLSGAAADKIDRSRVAAAGGLESAASALHEHADRLPGGAKVASGAHAAADALSSTADYVRENDLQSMMKDVQALVKKNPGIALLTAGALGFLIARTFSRD